MKLRERDSAMGAKPIARVQALLADHLSRPMAKGSGASLVLKLSGLVGGFLFAVAAARLLGPSGYGEVALAIAVMGIVGIVAPLGVDMLAVPRVAILRSREAWADLRGFARWALVVAGLNSGLFMLGVAAISLAQGPYAQVLIVTALAIPLLALLQVLRGLTQGMGIVAQAQLPMDVLRWIVALPLIGILALVPAAQSPQQVMVVLVASLLVSAGAALFIFRRYLRRYPTAATGGKPGNARLVEAFPMAAAALFGILGTEANTILLAWLSGPREAGLYQPIAKLAPIMLIAMEAIAMPLAPRIAALWDAGDRPALSRVMHRSTVAATIATTAVSGLIVLLSAYILGAFGPEFLEYRHYLLWIGAAYVFFAATGASPLLLTMTQNMRERIGAQSAALVVQIGLGLALIPSFGAGGAAVALVVAIVVSSCLHWGLAWRKTGINTSLLGVVSDKLRSRTRKSTGELL